MEQLYFEDVERDSEIPKLIRHVGFLELMRYSAATWNFYFLHLEKDFAIRKGYKDANIHAPYYGALLSTLLVQWVKNPGSLKRLQYRMKSMGYRGDILTAKGRVTKKYRNDGNCIVECALSVEREDGAALALGSATLSLPTRERQNG